MATPVTMPMLGLTMEEGTVAEWLKGEGEHVAKDEPLQRDARGTQSRSPEVSNGALGVGSATRGEG